MLSKSIGAMQDLNTARSIMEQLLKKKCLMIRDVSPMSDALAMPFVVTLNYIYILVFL